MEPEPLHPKHQTLPLTKHGQCSSRSVEAFMSCRASPFWQDRLKDRGKEKGRVGRTMGGEEMQWVERNKRNESLIQYVDTTITCSWQYIQLCKLMTRLIHSVKWLEYFCLDVWHSDSVIFASRIITLLARVFPFNDKVESMKACFSCTLCGRNSDGGNPCTVKCINSTIDRKWMLSKYCSLYLTSVNSKPQMKTQSTWLPHNPPVHQTLPLGVCTLCVCVCERVCV